MSVDYCPCGARADAPYLKHKGDMMLLGDEADHDCMWHNSVDCMICIMCRQVDKYSMAVFRHGEDVAEQRFQLYRRMRRGGLQ